MVSTLSGVNRHLSTYPLKRIYSGFPYMFFLHDTSMSWQDLTVFVLFSTFVECRICRVYIVDLIISAGLSLSQEVPEAFWSLARASSSAHILLG